jgi:hypothetical protein
MRQFFGKYRGKVTNNVDPEQRGRVQVSVPAVLGDGRSTWAEACTPHSGPGQGLYLVPPVGGAVWVEFEAGDPRHAILAGCRWEAGQVPGPGLPTAKVWSSEAVTITLDDLPATAGLTIEVGPPSVPVTMRLAMTAAGLELSVGSSSIVLTPASVAINKTALVVT